MAHRDAAVSDLDFSSTVRRIGSWWLRTEYALPNESPLWSVLANRLLSLSGVSNGRLITTTRRLMFCPRRFGRVTAGDSWAVFWESVRAVAVEPSPMDVIGFRDRPLIGIQLDDGTKERFWVVAPTRCARRLNHAMSRETSMTT